jgi:hypothetical protein
METTAMNRPVKRQKGPTLAAFALLFATAAWAGSPPPSTAPATTATGAPTASGLPTGVLRVLIGEAVRDRSATGIPRCMIPQPLPAPQRFEPGTTEIAYTIEVDPLVVKGVTAKVIGDPGCAEPWIQGCPAYTVCGGGVCQSQYGSTVKCPADKPLQKGSYKLSLTVGERTVELPFEIQ